MSITYTLKSSCLMVKGDSKFTKLEIWKGQNLQELQNLYKKEQIHLNYIIRTPPQIKILCLILFIPSNWITEDIFLQYTLKVLYVWNSLIFAHNWIFWCIPKTYSYLLVESNIGRSIYVIFLFTFWTCLVFGHQLTKYIM